MNDNHIKAKMMVLNAIRGMMNQEELIIKNCKEHAGSFENELDHVQILGELREMLLDVESGNRRRIKQ